MFLRKCSFLLAGLCLFGSAQALDIRPFVQFFFPSEVSVSKDSKAVSSEQEWETDFVIEAGSEILFVSEFLPLQAGAGLGFRTAQSNEDSKATPASLPAWGVLSFGRISDDNFFSPFVALRGGYLLPLSETTLGGTARSTSLPIAAWARFCPKELRWKPLSTIPPCKNPTQRRTSNTECLRSVSESCSV